MILPNLNFMNDNTQFVDELPYFPFLSVDSDRLITPTEVGKILIYKNQNNIELKFKVLKNKTKKNLKAEEIL